jgi:outer membrane protein assembly factor BamB
MEDNMIAAILVLLIITITESNDFNWPGINPAGTGICTDTAFQPTSADFGLLWRYRTNGTARGTAVVSAGNLVFCSSLEGELCALNVETGDLVWKDHYDYKQLSTTNSWGCVSHYGGSVYWNPPTRKGTLRRYDAKTGRLEWDRPDLPFYLYQVRSKMIGYGNKLYIAGNDKNDYDRVYHIVCLDTSTGDIDWSFVLNPDYDIQTGQDMSSNFCIDTTGKRLFFTYRNKAGNLDDTTANGDFKDGSGVYCIDLETRDTTGKGWTNHKVAPESYHSLTFVGDTLVFAQAVAGGGYMINATTGVLIRRPGTLGEMSPNSGRGQCVDDKYFYIAGYNSEIYVTDRAANVVANTVSARPAHTSNSGCSDLTIVKNSYGWFGIKVGGMRRFESGIGAGVCVYDMNKVINGGDNYEKLVFYYETMSNNCPTPCVANGRLFVYSTDGWVYAFGMQGKE